MPLPRLFGGIRKKTVACPIFHTAIFKRVLDIIQTKIGHLKGENKLESSGSLDSDDLHIDGLKATQGNELLVPDKISHFPQREGLSDCRQLRDEAYIWTS